MHSARLLRLGDLLAVRNAWPAAAHAYQSSRRHNGASTALIDRRLARALMAQGKLAQARALASASLAANPDQPEGHWLAAQIALASNDCAAAVAHLHEINLVNPFVAEVHESLAMCAEKRGDAQVQRQEIRFAALCAAPR